MGVRVRNTEQAIKLYESKGGRIDFKNDLLKIFEFVKKDSRINDIRELAYLLATSEVESGYSLSRWESDFVCRDSSGKSMRGRSYIGVLPNDKPCKSAIDYYCSTTGGKQNYCLSDFDKRGLPYFGRGLIQITWKSNYKKYGDLVRRGLGDELVNNPELVLLNPQISYDLAIAYLNEKRSGIYSKAGKRRSTFDLAKDGDLTLARRSVNGGTKSLDEVNESFQRWLDVFKNEDIPVREFNRRILKTEDGTIQKIAGFSLVFLSVVGLAFVFYKYTRQNK